MIVVFLGMLLAFAGPSDQADFLTWVAGADASRGWTALEPAPTGELALRMREPGYRFAEEIFREAATAVREKPGVVDVELLGETLQGRPIWAFHLGRPGESADRRVLVFGGIHAMEWISSDVASDLLLRLAAGALPDDTRVTIIPLLNPDGRAKVERDLDEGREVYRRGNGRNVDLNRDFAVNREARAFWRRLLPGYYRTSPGPLSQPETRALDELARRERYHRAASLHSFGGFFYHPWSARFGPLPQPARGEFVEMGRAMELAQGTRAYRTRQLGRWGFFFRAHGSEIDHLYGRYGTRGFLIEISRSGIRPLRPSTWRWGFRSYNPEIPRRMAKHRDRTVASLLALILHPETASEARARARGGALSPGAEFDEAP